MASDWPFEADDPRVEDYRCPHDQRRIAALEAELAAVKRERDDAIEELRGCVMTLLNGRFDRERVSAVLRKYPVDYVKAFEALAKAANGRWDDVDPDEFVRQLRHGDDTPGAALSGGGGGEKGGGE